MYFLYLHAVQLATLQAPAAWRVRALRVVQITLEITFLVEPLAHGPEAATRINRKAEPAATKLKIATRVLKILVSAVRFRPGHQEHSSPNANPCKLAFLFPEKNVLMSAPCPGGNPCSTRIRFGVSSEHTVVVRRQQIAGHRPFDAFGQSRRISHLAQWT